MHEFVEVIFRTERVGHFINSKNLKIEPDSLIVARVERGEDIGRVINCAVTDYEVESKLKKGEVEKLLRLATDEDLKQLEVVKRKEEESHKKFNKLVAKYPFEMKLLETVYQLDGNKLTFFFSADGRIDFREFVRELATEFKTRIELHQTSGREDARRYGGLGMCGKTYCCVTWLKKFDQITIKMAKDQNLLNNLSKISGPCGRLLCCLRYEEDDYLEKAEDFPKPEQQVFIEGKRHFVTKNDFYNGKIYLVNEENDIAILTLDQYSKIKKNGKKKPRS